MLNEFDGFYLVLTPTLSISVWYLFVLLLLVILNI